MEKGPAVSLDSAVSALLPNKRRVSALKSLGITTVGEALTYYPFRVSEPVPVLPIRSVRLGSPVAFAARVKWARVVPMGSKRGLRLDVLVSDEDFAASCGVASSSARLVFFSHRKSYIDWMSLRLRPGARVVLAGEPSVFNGQLQFTHPDVLLLPEAGGGEGGADPLPGSIRPDADSQEQALAKVSRPRPVYHANSRISSDHIHDAILGFIRLLARAHGGGTALGEQAQGATLGTAQSASQGQPFEGEMEPAIDAEAFGRAVPDILPESARVNGHYLHRAQAFLGMHDPGAVEDFREALRTLRFEEAFVSQTALLRSREDSRRVRAYPCPQPGQDSLVTRFVDSLPFRLTQGQEEVIGRIGGDMARDYPMQRLLQGEVGSGKTVVALAAMLQAVDAGFQAVLVAPTQVLAEQHFESIGRMLQALAASGPAASAGTEPTRPY